MVTSSSWSAAAAGGASFIYRSLTLSFKGLTKAATRFARGKSSRRIPSTLPLKSPGTNVAAPVTFPPGWARLDASPIPTGSATQKNAVGISEVASLAARADCGEVATMRSGLDCTSSAASAGSWSRRVPVSLRSMTIVVPSTQPSLRSSSQKVFILGPAHAEHSTPTWGGFDAAWVLVIDGKTSSRPVRTGNAVVNRLIGPPIGLPISADCDLAHSRPVGLHYSSFQPSGPQSLSTTTEPRVPLGGAAAGSVFVGGAASRDPPASFALTIKRSILRR